MPRGVIRLTLPDLVALLGLPDDVEIQAVAVASAQDGPIDLFVNSPRLPARETMWGAAPKADRERIDPWPIGVNVTHHAAGYCDRLGQPHPHVDLYANAVLHDYVGPDAHTVVPLDELLARGEKKALEDAIQEPPPARTGSPFELDPDLIGRRP